MADEQKSKLRLEIAHVLFIDIVGYSKLRTNEQSAQIEKLREIVRGTEQFSAAEAEGKLLRLPTGDGGALAFPETFERNPIAGTVPSALKKRQPSSIVPMAIAALMVLGATILFLTTRTAFRNITGRGGPASAISEKSIAVLPFQNLSDDRSNAYFTDGIQDEILTRLSKIAALKVISRTSTQKSKSTPENFR